MPCRISLTPPPSACCGTSPSASPNRSRMRYVIQHHTTVTYENWFVCIVRINVLPCLGKKMSVMYFLVRSVLLKPLFCFVCDKGNNWGNTSCFKLSFLSLSFSSCTQNFFQASKYIPDICVIRAVQKIVWASGCGSVQHVFSSNEEISKIYEKVLVLSYIEKYVWFIRIRFTMIRLCIYTCDVWSPADECWQWAGRRRWAGVLWSSGGHDPVFRPYAHCTRCT